MNLLHLVTWVRDNTDVDAHVLVVDDGPITHRFQQICPTTVLDIGRVHGKTQLVYRALRRLGSRRAAPMVQKARLWPQIRALGDFDLVYLNSAASAGVADALGHDGPVVAHVHELDVALTTMWPQDQAVLVERPDLFVAASHAVATALHDALGIDAERIAVHHEFIDTSAFQAGAVTLREVERIRKSQRIPAEAAIVMGVGTVDWRKGPDLFVQLGAQLRRHTRELVHLVWVGGDLTGVDMVRLHSDMRRAGTDHVHFVGTIPDPRVWFAAADVLVLTSREDPFPLVCLEHASLGHPIVTYRNGGMVELLEAAGPAASHGVVEYLDVATMASTVLDFLGDEDLRERASAELMARVHGHHDVAVAAPRLWADVTALWD